MHEPERRHGERRHWTRRQSPGRRRKDRMVAWWHTYAGSVAFAAVLAVSAIGFWQAYQHTAQLEETTAMLQSETVRQDSALVRLGRAESSIVREREERIATMLQVQQETAQRGVDNAVASALAYARATQLANLEGCRRDNELKMRLRNWVGSQLEINSQMGTAVTPLLSVGEFIQLMNRQADVLRALYVELGPINCDRAYPDVQR